MVFEVYISRAKTLEDFLLEYEVPNIDIPKSSKWLSTLGLSCWPTSNLSSGKMGIVIFHESDPNLSYFCEQQIFPKAETKRVTSAEEFEEAFNDSIINDHLILRYDNPAKLQIGFICVKRKPVWYLINLLTVKLYVSSRTR